MFGQSEVFWGLRKGTNRGTKTEHSWRFSMAKGPAGKQPNFKTVENSLSAANLPIARKVGIRIAAANLTYSVQERNMCMLSLRYHVVRKTDGADLPIMLKPCRGQRHEQATESIA